MDDSASPLIARMGYWNAVMAAEYVDTCNVIMGNTANVGLDFMLSRMPYA